MRYWVQNGCAPDKLVVSLPTYGRCFSLTDVDQTGVEAPASGPCAAGKYTQEAGFLSYYEVRRAVFNGRFLWRIFRSSGAR